MPRMILTQRHATCPIETVFLVTWILIIVGPSTTLTQMPPPTFTPCDPAQPLFMEYGLPSGFTHFGDMILPFAGITGTAAWTPTPWPGGVIPYQFASALDSLARTHVLRSMAEIEALGAVDFVPRNATHAQYLEISSSGAVWSIYAAWVPEIISQGWGASVGAPTGAMPHGMMYLPGDVALLDAGMNTVHALMHVLGFIDEECRRDRDTYITVDLGRTMPFNGRAQETSVGPMPNGSSWSCGGPYPPDPLWIVNHPWPSTAYDFASIMHGSRFQWCTSAFVGNFQYWKAAPQITITCNPGYTQYQPTMGHRAYLTHADALDIAAL